MSWAMTILASSPFVSGLTQEYTMRLNHIAHAATLSALLASTSAAHATIELIATGSLSGTASDLSGLTGNLENGVSASLLGGMGSGLAWAGGNTFLALPDRGPNAASYNATVDNTTSYIARFQTVTLDLTAAPTGSALPYTLTPTLKGTTLLYSTTPLNYGSTAGLPNGAPALNSAGKYYFTGRSDGFATGTGLNSSNPDNARLDPEGIRVSNDGKTAFISDEYGPYIYKFNALTGERIGTITLPSNLSVNNLSTNGATEISGNTSGRVANKGMEGLAITPDGSKLVGFMQSPLIQDGGDKTRYNRIITVNTSTGLTHEYAYDNLIGSKSFNSSEILALNDHQFLVLERDGSGLGDGSTAAVKQLRLVDIAGATDVSALSGAAALAPYALSTSKAIDIFKILTDAGIPADLIPAKLEGMAFGEDIVDNGVTKHTLYLGNDNDFLNSVVTASHGTVSYDNKWYVFSFSDTDLTGIKAGTTFTQQGIATMPAVPEPASYAMVLAGLSVAALMRRRVR
jgi:hypothetical protein